MCGTISAKHENARTYVQHVKMVQSLRPQTPSTSAVEPGSGFVGEKVVRVIKYLQFGTFPAASATKC